MRWFVIIWLLLDATAFICAPFSTASRAGKFLSMLDDVRDTYSHQKSTGEKEQAYNRLTDATSQLHSMLVSPSVKLLYVGSTGIGLMAFFSSLLLMVRKPLGVKMGLITLAAVLVWGIFMSLSMELFIRKKMKSAFQTTYESVSILSEEEVKFSPELQQALKPDLVTPFFAYGIDLLFLVLLFKKREVILRTETIQPIAPANASEPRR